MPKLPKIAYGMRVLVVDDELMVQMLLEQFLSSEGHEVVVASNGKEALARLEEASYDLIFTDVHMPLMDGVEFVRQVRSRDLHCPIVVMDSYPDLFLESGSAQEALAVLAKPFDLWEVRQILHAIEPTQVGLRR
ncbi:MAG: response regulator [Fimbriimonadales bacterium]